MSRSSYVPFKNTPISRQDVERTMELFKQNFYSIEDTVDRFRAYAWLLGHGASFDPEFDLEINN